MAMEDPGTGSAEDSGRSFWPLIVYFLVIVIGVVVLMIRYPRGKTGEEQPSPSSEARRTADTSEHKLTKIGSYKLLDRVPHDTSAFTQGLIAVQLANGTVRLYESTGMYNMSELRILDLQGNVLERTQLEPTYFGEGIAHYPTNHSSSTYGLLQLTWREKTMFEYRIDLESSDDSSSMQMLQDLSFSTTKNEGWGITYDPDDQLFYVTDGSQYLHVWDNNRTELRKVEVTYQVPGQTSPQRLNYLNELEWDPVTRTVLSNVLTQNIIARIHPTTGFVETVYVVGHCHVSFFNSRNSQDTSQQVQF